MARLGCGCGGVNGQEDTGAACGRFGRKLVVFCQTLVNGTGFHSPSNRRRLDQMLQLNALPDKGNLSKMNQGREQAAEFVTTRQARKEKSHLHAYAASHRDLGKGLQSVH